MAQHLLPTALALIGATLVAGHGSLVIPPSRNNYQQKDPANQTGSSHMNQGPCVGGACLWFSEGCFLGCPECSANMPAGGNQIDAPNCTGFVANTPTLPEQYRTFNKGNRSPNGDWTRYHPWRSPGKAPVSDPCGVAGGYTVPTGGGGETPPGAKQGNKGSKLPPTSRKIEWQAGKAGEVGWMVAANHGGGYSYSLCPKSEPITEACFNKLSLPFADKSHTIRYLLSGKELAIPATDVTEGTFPAGSAWRLSPIPACACDWGRGCHVGGKGAQQAYSNCTTCDYFECGKNVDLQWGPEPFPYGHGQQIWNRKVGTPEADDWVIIDRVAVPTTPGDYVLRWRWDTEHNPQVWTNCADVTITDHAPTPQPPSGNFM